MNSDSVFFYLYAAIAIAGALGLVISRRLVHAVLSLLVNLFAVAALYLLLGSQFLAAMQLFIYGGAVTVLVLFVLMLTDPQAREASSATRVTTSVALVLCVGFFAILARTLGGSSWEFAASVPHDTASIASILFSRYVLPFEVAGLVLTIALIGSIVLAREEAAETVNVAALQSQSPAAAEGEAR